MIKGVILDLDGVYFKNGHSNFIANLKDKFGVPEEQAKAVYRKSTQMMFYKKAKISGQEFWKYAMDEWKIKTTMAKLLDMLFKGYDVNEGAKVVLGKLKANGIKSIVCSDNFKERVEGLDKKFRFKDDFDYCIFSYEYGMMKPELLLKVVERTHIQPKEILLIDDRQELIDAARHMGFNAMVCDSPGKILDIIRAAGVRI